MDNGNDGGPLKRTVVERPDGVVGERGTGVNGTESIGEGGDARGDVSVGGATGGVTEERVWGAGLSANDIGNRGNLGVVTAAEVPGVVVRNDLGRRAIVGENMSTALRSDGRSLDVVKNTETGVVGMENGDVTGGAVGAGGGNVDGDITRIDGGGAVENLAEMLGVKDVPEELRIKEKKLEKREERAPEENLQVVGRSAEGNDILQDGTEILNDNFREEGTDGGSKKAEDSWIKDVETEVAENGDDPRKLFTEVNKIAREYQMARFGETVGNGND